MKYKILFLMIFISQLSFANDGGIYSVQPKQTKVDAQNQAISFSGQFAVALQKLIPPSFSVVTQINPKIKSSYDKNMRVLALRDEKGAALIITCRSAEMDFEKEKPEIKELADTHCSFEFTNKLQGDWGDVHNIPVAEALKKASEANKIK